MLKLCYRIEGCYCLLAGVAIGIFLSQAVLRATSDEASGFDNIGETSLNTAAIAETGFSARIYLPPKSSPEEAGELARTPEQRLRVQHTGKCLHVSGGLRLEGQNVVQWTCGDGNHQKWNYKEGQLKAMHSGRCLGILGGKRENNTNVVQISCGSGDHQKWSYNGDTKQFIALHSQMCLSVMGRFEWNGASVQQAVCTNSPHQKWDVLNVYVGEGHSKPAVFNLKHSDTKLRYKGVTWSTPESSILFPVADGTVYAPNGLVTNQSGAFTLGYRYWEGHVSKVSHIATPPRNEQIYLSLIEKFDNFFQHMVFDTLPKVSFSCQFLIEYESVLVLVMNQKQLKLIREVCPLPRERFKITNRPIHASVVYIPYFYHPEAWLKYGNVPPNSLMTLGSRTKQGTRIVYLARQRGRTRSVQNVDQVLGILKKVWKGRVDVYGESLATSPTRESVANARVIIGPHGGALANMIFSPVNTTIIEFVPLLQYKRNSELDEASTYFGLAQALGFEYHSIQPKRFDLYHGQMFVPIGALQELVKTLDLRLRFST